MSDFAPMPIKLSVSRRWYQENFIAHRNHHFFNDDNKLRILYTAPTGSGKSFMFLDALGSDPFGWGITNRLEIVAGMLEKCGENVSGLNTNQLVELAWQYRITTPIRYRNALRNGDVPFLPWRLYIDEVHHDQANTFKDIYAFLPAVSVCGLTATPFRGTARSTAEFMQSWDKIVHIIDIPTAAKEKVIEIPEIEIWPLVDDDEIEISNGEFSTTNASNLNVTRSAELVQRILNANWLDTHYQDVIRGHNEHDSIEVPHWDKPTIFAVSSREQALDLRDRCNAANIPVTVINQESSRYQRQQAFKECVSCLTAIIQIDVVSEGVDLPIRRIIDMRPTFSPVRWLQLIGRSTRPGAVSTYICCNRNLERHAYLMCGMFPPSKIAEAQTIFGGISQRSQQTRAVGTEGLGRLKPTMIKFTDGTTGSVYNLHYFDKNENGIPIKKELAVLLHPNKNEPIIALKESVKKEDGTYDYGHWKELQYIPDVTGYASAPGGVITEKQAASWMKWAKSFGLDSSVIPNRKNIQAYYLLRDLRCYKFRT